MSAPVLITLSGIDKRFGGQAALDKVDFQLRRGEIHALLGENGAGKSTLIKILAGVVTRDAGEITIGDHTIPRHHRAPDVKAAGLAFVHQDLGLVESMSVAENLALTNGYVSKGPFISQHRTRRQIAAVLAELQIDIDPGALIASLTHDQKVMVAVARAFSSHAQAIVLDEVSSSLPAPDTARLGASLRRSRERGLGYVYVTHRLDEVFGLADRITVLRDGRLVVTTETQSVSMQELVELITGAPGLETPRAAGPRQAGRGLAAQSGLRVTGLNGPGLSEPLSFDIEPGQILGVCGLVASGAGAVTRLLGGAATPSMGSASLGQTSLPLGSPVQMRAQGCDYVPGDRVAAGAFLTLSIRENLFPIRRRRAPEGDRSLIWPRRERNAAQSLVKRFKVRPNRVEAVMGTLSGGNQQKVVVARSIRAAPRLLVLEDPTAGVDIGSRAQIYTHIKAIAASGTVVLLASSDFQEVVALTDRALVLSHGRVTADLLGPDITEARLSEASYLTEKRPEEVLS